MGSNCLTASTSLTKNTYFIEWLPSYKAIDSDKQGGKIFKYGLLAWRNDTF